MLATIMFADNIVLIVENECKPYCLLDVLHEWNVNWDDCAKRQYKYVVHFHKKQTPTVSFVILTHLPTLSSISTSEESSREMLLYLCVAFLF